MNTQELTKKCQTFMKKNNDLNNLSLPEANKTYYDFQNCITKHNDLYYTHSSPIISDYEYDQIFLYLKKIEEFYPQIISQDSPTQTLQDQLSKQDSFQKAEHAMQMLSLENSYNAKDLEERHKRITKILEKNENENENKNKTNISLYCEPKIDGVSIELIYKNGKLQQAITRGDGSRGEDVTANIKTIQNIPQQIPEKKSISFRGEIIIPKSERRSINQQREKKGETPYANTRNLAAGSLKQLDPNITKKRKLACYVYDYSIHTEKKKRETNEKNKENKENEEKNYRTYIQTQGFAYLTLANAKTSYENIEDLINYCEAPDTKKQLENNYPNIDFDGLVIKCEGEEIRKVIGSTDHHPRRAIAFKFPAEQVATQIEEIKYQVGRTGAITPVAILTPVKLSGATISKASLHNFDFIEKKDIRPQDRVYLQRSGEVIPYIVSVIKERREEQPQQRKIPTACPSCQTALIKEEIYLRCPNSHHCPEQIKQKISHAVSKQCLNIEGLGEKVVDMFVEQKILGSFMDIYTLNDEETQRRLRSLPGIGKKRIEELEKQTEKSKKAAIRRKINALGLPGIGKKMAKELAKEIENRKITNAETLLKFLSDEETLTTIHGIGKTIIQSLNERTEEAQNISLINQSDTYQRREKQETTSGKKTASSLTDLHFSITGSFELSRPHIIEILESLGAVFDSSPNKKTDFMLVGEKPGSKKAKAEKLGIKIYSGLKELEEKRPETRKEIDIKKKKDVNKKMKSLF